MNNLRPTIKINSLDFDFSSINLFVQSFEISKTLEDGAGSFSITLAPSSQARHLLTTPFSRNFLFEKLNYNDVVTISYAGIPIMTGLIDSIARFEGYSKTFFQKGVVIGGRDFGSVLVDDNLGYIYSSMFEHTEELEALRLVLPEDHAIFKIPFGQRAPGGTFLGKQIYEAVEFIFENLTSLKVPLVFDGKQFEGFDFIRHEILHYPDDVIGADFNNNTYQGSVFNFLYQLIDQDYYEIFVDTWPFPVGVKGAGHPVLRVRPKPFSHAGDPLSQNDEFGWDKNTTWITGENHHIVRANRLLDYNDNVNKSDIFSVFYTQLQREVLFDNGFSNFGLSWPIIDARLLNLYGFRPKHSSSGLITIPRRENEFEYNRLFEKRNKYYAWHRYNEHYLSGTAKVIGNPYFRVGDRIYFEGITTRQGNLGIEAYITGLKWSYSADRDDDPKLITEVQFSRGHNKNELRYFLQETSHNVVEINGGLV